VSAADLEALLASRDIAALEVACAAAAAGSAEALALAGELLRRRGEPARAAPLLDRALALRPGSRALHHACALAHAATGARGDARARWQALLALDPGDPAARFQIAVTYHDEGRLDDAATWYEAQAAAVPGMFAAWWNLGLVQQARGAPDAALAAWQRAASLAPGDPRPLARAAAVHGAAARLPAAIALLDRAIALAPQDPSLRFARAAHCSSLALHRPARDDLARAVELQPDNPAGGSALLLECQYDDAPESRAVLGAARAAWSRRHAQVEQHVHAVAAPGTRLRVGYLSPRFGDAPAGALLLPVLEAHDRARFELVAFATHPPHGPIAERMRRAVARWHDLPGDDAQAFAAIAGEDLDLLIDLAGHAPGNRLPLLARRPARVQAAWLDAFDPSGVPALDFLLSDAVHTPPQEAADYRERLVLLPRARFCYRPPDVFGAAAPPVPGRDGATFGSFNRHAKHTDEVARTWGRILAAVPGARLSLRAAAYRAAATVDFVRARWRGLGLPVERIDFAPFVALEALHEAYAGIDVALDPFPFTGGVTTCDALAHGVPVVTLAGRTMIGRQGAALLRAAGEGASVATTIDDYVAIAAALGAAAPDAQAKRARAGRVAASPLCDVAAFTRALERAFVAMVDAGPGSGPPLAIAAAAAQVRV
jgi:predicted O-linked N-acetylglucosamine transferase (SPINDLY family)